MIYLDSAATTFQKPPSVVRAMNEAMATMTSPGRGDYGPSARASQTLLALREEAASLFHVKDPERVVLTTSATHGLNIAIRSLVRPGYTVLLTGLEHNAVTRPLAAIPGVHHELLTHLLDVLTDSLALDEFILSTLSKALADKRDIRQPRSHSRFLTGKTSVLELSNQ